MIEVSEPFLMVHRYRVPDEAAYVARLTDWFGYIADNHPQVLHHKVYQGPAAGEVTNVQVHPDAASMALMMQLFLARASEWSGLIEPDGQDFLLCGDPPEELVSNMRMGVGSAPLGLARPWGGFSRLGD